MRCLSASMNTKSNGGKPSLASLGNVSERGADANVHELADSSAGEVSARDLGVLRVELS
jgi:hypothetical protein